MATKDKQPLDLGRWMGLWRRGDVPPGDHMHTCTNTMFRDSILYPRPPFEELRTLGLEPLRAFPFKLSTAPVVSRWLMLTFNTGIGLPQVYEVIVGGASTLVATLGSALSIDMNVLVAFDRAYLTFHDRIRASQFESLVVWDPSFMAAGRNAAGPKPTGTFTVAVSATAGNVEAGQHVYAVANEYDTGHVTVPNLYVSLTSPAGFCVDLTAIPLGPAGVVARWILMSRVVNNPDPNLANIKVFFGFRVPDNVTTTLAGTAAINLYDSQLISDADYLKDLYESIPCGVAIGLYSNRLILGNVHVPIPPVPNLPILPPKVQHSLLLGSKPGLLESISKVDGFRQISKSEGGGIKHISENNGILYARKSFMSFALQDNGAEFNKWPINQLDIAAGTEPFGVASFPGTSSGSTKNRQVVCDRSGLFNFDGQYQDEALTYKVEEIWRSISQTRFAEIMVTIDPERNRLAVLLPPHTDPITGAAYPNMDRILLGDFAFGLDPQNIRWSYWLRIVTGTVKDAVGLNFDYLDTLIPRLSAITKTVGNPAGEIYVLPDDLSVGVGRTQATWEMAVQMHPIGGLGHFEAARVRMAKIVDSGGTATLTLANKASNAGVDPNAISKTIDLIAQAHSFYNFSNVHKQLNRSGMETAWLGISVNSSLALNHAWLWISPSDEEKLT